MSSLLDVKVLANNNEKIELEVKCIKPGLKPYHIKYQADKDSKGNIISIREKQHKLNPLCRLSLVNGSIQLTSSLFCNSNSKIKITKLGNIELNNIIEKSKIKQLNLQLTTQGLITCNKTDIDSVRATAEKFTVKSNCKVNKLTLATNNFVVHQSSRVEISKNFTGSIRELNNNGQIRFGDHASAEVKIAKFNNYGKILRILSQKVNEQINFIIKKFRNLGEISVNQLKLDIIGFNKKIKTEEILFENSGVLGGRHEVEINIAANDVKSVNTGIIWSTGDLIKEIQGSFINNGLVFANNLNVRNKLAESVSSYINNNLLINLKDFYLSGRVKFINSISAISFIKKHLRACIDGIFANAANVWAESCELEINSFTNEIPSSPGSTKSVSNAKLGKKIASKLAKYKTNSELSKVISSMIKFFNTADLTVKSCPRKNNDRNIANFTTLTRAKIKCRQEYKTDNNSIVQSGGKLTVKKIGNNPSSDFIMGGLTSGNALKSLNEQGQITIPKKAVQHSQTSATIAARHLLNQGLIKNLGSVLRAVTQLEQSVENRQLTLVQATRLLKRLLKKSYKAHGRKDKAVEIKELIKLESQAADKFIKLVGMAKQDFIAADTESEVNLQVLDGLNNGVVLANDRLVETVTCENDTQDWIEDNSITIAKTVEHQRSKGKLLQSTDSYLGSTQGIEITTQGLSQAGTMVTQGEFITKITGYFEQILSGVGFSKISASDMVQIVADEITLSGLIDGDNVNLTSKTATNINASANIFANKAINILAKSLVNQGLLLTRGGFEKFLQLLKTKVENKQLSFDIALTLLKEIVNRLMAEDIHNNNLDQDLVDKLDSIYSSKELNIQQKLEQLSNYLAKNVQQGESGAIYLKADELEDRGYTMSNGIVEHDIAKQATFESLVTAANVLSSAKVLNTSEKSNALADKSVVTAIDAHLSGLNTASKIELNTSGSTKIADNSLLADDSLDINTKSNPDLGNINVPGSIQVSVKSEDAKLKLSNTLVSTKKSIRVIAPSIEVGTDAKLGSKLGVVLGDGNTKIVDLGADIYSEEASVTFNSKHLHQTANSTVIARSVVDYSEVSQLDLQGKTEALIEIKMPVITRSIKFNYDNFNTANLSINFTDVDCIKLPKLFLGNLSVTMSGGDKKYTANHDVDIHGTFKFDLGENKLIIGLNSKQYTKYRALAGVLQVSAKEIISKYAGFYGKTGVTITTSEPMSLGELSHNKNSYMRSPNGNLILNSPGIASLAHYDLEAGNDFQTNYMSLLKIVSSNLRVRGNWTVVQPVIISIAHEPVKDLFKGQKKWPGQLYGPREKYGKQNFNIIEQVFNTILSVPSNINIGGTLNNLNNIKLLGSNLFFSKQAGNGTIDEVNVYSGYSFKHHYLHGHKKARKCWWGSSQHEENYKAYLAHVSTLSKYVVTGEHKQVLGIITAPSIKFKDMRLTVGLDSNVSLPAEVKQKYSEELASALHASGLYEKSTTGDYVLGFDVPGNTKISKQSIVTFLSEGFNIGNPNNYRFLLSPEIQEQLTKHLLFKLVHKGYIHKNVPTQHESQYLRQNMVDFVRAGGSKEKILRLNRNLLIAVLDNNPATVVELIKQGANINKGDKDNLTALHYAILTRNIELVRLLIEAGVDINVCSYAPYSFTPLYLAVLTGNIDIVRELVSYKDLDINYKNDSTGLTAIELNEKLKSNIFSPMLQKQIDYIRTGLQLLEIEFSIASASSLDETAKLMLAESIVNIATRKQNLSEAIGLQVSPDVAKIRNLDELELAIDDPVRFEREITLKDNPLETVLTTIDAYPRHFINTKINYNNGVILADDIALDTIEQLLSTGCIWANSSLVANVKYTKLKQLVHEYKILRANLTCERSWVSKKRKVEHVLLDIANVIDKTGIIHGGKVNWEGVDWEQLGGLFSAGIGGRIATFRGNVDIKNVSSKNIDYSNTSGRSRLGLQSAKVRSYISQTTVVPAIWRSLGKSRTYIKGDLITTAAQLSSMDRQQFKVSGKTHLGAAFVVRQKHKVASKSKGKCVQAEGTSEQVKPTALTSSSHIGIETKQLTGSAPQFCANSSEFISETFVNFNVAKTTDTTESKSAGMRTLTCYEKDKTILKTEKALQPVFLVNDVTIRSKQGDCVIISPIIIGDEDKGSFKVYADGGDIVVGAATTSSSQEKTTYSLGFDMTGLAAISAMSKGDLKGAAKSLVNEMPLIASMIDLANAESAFEASGAALTLAGNCADLYGLRKDGKLSNFSDLKGSLLKNFGFGEDGKWSAKNLNFSVRFGVEKQKHNWTEVVSSVIKTGRILLTSTRDVNIFSSNIDCNYFDVKAGRNVNLDAEKEKTKTKTENAGVTVGYSAGAPNVGADVSLAKTNSTKYVGTRIKARESATISAKDTAILRNAFLETAVAFVEANAIVIESQCDESRSKSVSASANTSGTVSASVGSSHSKIIDTQAGISATDSLVMVTYGENGITNIGGLVEVHNNKEPVSVKCKGQDIELYEVEVPKDGDCFLHSIGVPRFKAANQLLNCEKLLAKPQADLVYKMVAEEIELEIYRMLLTSDTMLPRSMNLNPILNIKEKYLKDERTLDAVANRLRNECNLKEEKYSSPDVLLQSLRTKEHKARLRKAMKAVHEHKVKIKEFASSKIAFKEYVSYYVASPSAWLSFRGQEGINARRTHGTIDAIALLNNLELNIFSKDEGADILTLKHYYKPKDVEIKRVVNIQYKTNEQHFNILHTKPGYMQTDKYSFHDVDEKQKSISLNGSVSGLKGKEVKSDKNGKSGKREYNRAVSAGVNNSDNRGKVRATMHNVALAQGQKHDLGNTDLSQSRVVTKDSKLKSKVSMSEKSVANIKTAIEDVKKGNFWSNIKYGHDSELETSKQELKDRHLVLNSVGGSNDSFSDHEIEEEEEEEEIEFQKNKVVLIKDKNGTTVARRECLREYIDDKYVFKYKVTIYYSDGSIRREVLCSGDIQNDGSLKTNDSTIIDYAIEENFSDKIAGLTESEKIYSFVLKEKPNDDKTSTGNVSYLYGESKLSKDDIKYLKSLEELAHQKKKLTEFRSRLDHLKSEFESGRKEYNNYECRNKKRENIIIGLKSKKDSTIALKNKKLKEIDTLLNNLDGSNPGLDRLKRTEFTRRRESILRTTNNMIAKLDSKIKSHVNEDIRQRRDAVTSKISLNHITRNKFVRAHKGEDSFLKDLRDIDGLLTSATVREGSRLLSGKLERNPEIVYAAAGLGLATSPGGVIIGGISYYGLSQDPVKGSINHAVSGVVDVVGYDPESASTITEGGTEFVVAMGTGAGSKLANQVLNKTVRPFVDKMSMEYKNRVLAHELNAAKGDFSQLLSNPSTKQETRFVRAIGGRGAGDGFVGGNAVDISKLKLTGDAKKFYDHAKKLEARGAKNKAQEYFQSALNAHYENLVQLKMGGKQGYIKHNGKNIEFDCITDDSIIEVKRGLSALEKPDNFLNDKGKRQIKRTIEIAQSQNKNAEFWFKYGVHPNVRNYIQERGGIVKIGLDINEASVSLSQSSALLSVLKK